MLALSLVLVGVTACRAQVDGGSSASSDEATQEQEPSAAPRLPGPPGNEGSDAGPRFTSPLPVPVRAGGAEDTARIEAWRDDLDDDAARVGQLLMLRIYGGEIDEADPRNRALYGVATPREVIETFRPGGILLFRTDAGDDTGNLRDPRQVRTFTDDLRKVSGELGPPVTIAVDQEGGLVDRIGHFGTPYPTARELAGDAGAAADQAEVTITELTALGIDMNFAPVADVDSEATNPIIGARAYSEDPETVAEMVVAQLEAYRDRGVVPVLKHFPGHGDTTQDSHHTLPTVDADLELLRDRELVPFARAIEAGAQAIMTAHLRLPEVSGGGPTSMSPAVVTDLLRDELGFEGLIVTDSLEMEGARQDRADRRVALDALQAGHDLLVLPPAPRQSRALLERALANERLDEEQVDASVDRSLELKATLADADEDRPEPGVVGSDRMERTLTD